MNMIKNIDIVFGSSASWKPRSRRFAPTGASLQLVPKTTEVYNVENVENK
jgi:hypothetical protein